MDLQSQLRLVYAGEVLDGFARDDVKRRFGEMFKLEGDRLAAVFSGKPMVLKRGLLKDDAERYVERLVRIGMRVQVEPHEGPTSSSSSVSTAPATPRSPVAAAVAATAPELTAEAPRLVPLEEEVECPNCGERQPKRFVLCRKCTTDIPRALASRQEDADRARAERLAARQAASGGRYAPPGAEVGEVYASGDRVDPPPMLSLSFEGRMGRASYVNAFGLFMVVFALMSIAAAVIVPATGSVAIFIPMALLLIPGILWAFRISALRLHDLNRSGWWVLISLVPYVNLLLNIVLLLVPGSSEENDFGAKPRRGNMVLASIVALLFVGSMISVGVVSNRAYKQYTERAQRAQQQAEEQQANELDASAARRLPPGVVYDAFRDQYTPASDNKAFAISGKSAWGMGAGKTNTREAIMTALAACEERREPYTGACRVVNVNGSWPKERD